MLVCLCGTLLFAQTEQSVLRAAKGKEGTDPNSIVSIKADVAYNKTIQMLGEMSKKRDGKILIDRSSMRDKDAPIGINIESMYWKDALELILRSNKLWYNDNPDYMEIVTIEELNRQAAGATRKEEPRSQSQQQALLPKDITQPGMPIQLPVAVVPKEVDSSEVIAKTREITISTVFFELNTKKVAESGISFSFFRGNNLNLGVNLHGAEQMVNQYTNTGGTTSPYYGVTATPSGLSVDMSAAMAIFETNQLGEVIARPQITVRSGASANIQIGQDFSVLEKDFSGNTVSKFYPTGTILTVRPRVYKFKGVDFIDLNYNVEKSSVTTSATATSIIDREKAEGSLLLINGEEGYVGGMYNNQVTTSRTGVPILKDLPWWVFGLRYIFGYEYESVTKRELIVLMKAELVPLIEDRAAAAQKTGKKDVLQETRKDIQKDIDKHSTKK
jgi:type IV pilus assembly protein PilQ